MSGIKYILRNECTSPALITYQNYSNQLWQYQVEFLPGQTRTIWATEGTLSYDLTKTCIRVLSKTPYPSTSTTPSQPSTNPNVVYTNQYLIQVSTLVNSNNWEYSVLNYENATILGPIDLGISNSTWNYPNIQETLNGWMIRFENNTNDDVKVYFINKTGTINYLYDVTTNDFDYGTTSNRFAYFADFDNLKFVFSDFSSTYTYDIPSNWDSFYVDDNYDNGNYVGLVVYLEVGSYSEYILFKSGGYQTLFNYNNNDYSVECITYYKSNFFSFLFYSYGGNAQTFYNIYNSNGTLINSLNLLENSLTSINSVNLNTSTVSGSINGTFSVEQSSTSGSGTGATFLVSISSGNVDYVIPYGRGLGYSVGNTITFNGTLFGGSSGVDNVSITVNSTGNFDLEFYDVQAFGDGKISMILWGYDNTIPYFIVTYDGISNQFITTSHDRNALIYGYYDWQQMYTYLDDFSSWYEPSNDFHINFYDDNGGWDDDFYTVDDCDIVSWFDSTKEFSVYEFAKNVNYDYSIALYYYYVGQSLILNTYKDDSYLRLDIVQSTGITSFTTVTTNALDSWSLDDSPAGNYYVLGYDLPSSVLLNIYKYDGTQIDSLYFINYDYWWRTEYNSFSMTDYFNENSYYWNSNSNSIQQTPFYNDWDDINYYYTPSNKNNGQQLLWEDNNYTSQVLTQNTLSVVRTLPVIIDYSIKITRNLVALLTYNNGGKLVVYVYDLNYNLLNTITTNENNWDTFACQENRIYLQTYDVSNNYVHYLITANTFRKVVTSDYSSNWAYNDWQ